MEGRLPNEGFVNLKKCMNRNQVAIANWNEISQQKGVFLRFFGFFVLCL